MATYKNRAVQILQELPHPQGAQVWIEHMDGITGKEIVPRNQVVVSDKELADLKKQREGGAEDMDEFKIEGKTDKNVERVQSVSEVISEQLASRNEEQAKKDAKRAEEVAKTEKLHREGNFRIKEERTPTGEGTVGFKAKK